MMIKKLVLAVFLFALTLSAHDLPAKKGSERYHDNGALKRIKLTSPTEVDGYPCMRWLWFYENGLIRQFQTSEDITPSGIPIPQKSTLFLDEDGRLEQVYLYHDIEIQGYICPGSRWAKPVTGFYPNGQLRLFFPPAAVTIQGFPVKPGGRSGVYFYESGQLKQFYLNAPMDYRGVFYEKGTRLLLDGDGAVIGAY